MMTARKKILAGVMPAVLAVVAVGCGGGDSGGGGGGGAAAGPVEMPFDVATAGHVTGSISFEGTAPANATIDMSSESACAAKHTSTPMREDFKVAGGMLADVFVYVKSGLEGMAFPIPSTPVEIDQNGCQYLPHVAGVQVGQGLVFRNSDGVLHNISASPSVNRPFNNAQPGAVTTLAARTFAQPEIMIPVQCDVHGWMSSFVGVTAHPYHAVSGANGSFSLRDLPPGEYVIEAWHSRLGVQEQTVTVTTGQTTEISFTFNESMIANAVVPMGEPIDLHDHGPIAMLSDAGTTGRAR